MRKQSFLGLAAAAAILALQATAPAEESSPGEVTAAETKAVPPRSTRPPKLSEPDWVFRISYFPGFTDGSLRKDADGLEGSRVDLREELHADVISHLASISGGFKTGGNIWAFLKLGAFFHSGDSSSADPFDFDGIKSGGGGVEYSARCLMLDFTALAVPSTSDDYSLAVGLGVKYAGIDVEIDSSVGILRETADGLYPFIGLKARIGLTGDLEIEAMLDFSIFAYVSEEVVIASEETEVYVDAWGNPVASNTKSSKSRRYLLNRHNAFIDFYAGVRYRLAPGLGIALGFRSFFLNSEESGGDLEEDMEFRLNGLELSVILEF